MCSHALRKVAKNFYETLSLVQHLDCGKHQRALEQETLFDKAEYAEQLEGEASDVSGHTICVHK